MMASGGTTLRKVRRPPCLGVHWQKRSVRSTVVFAGSIGRGFVLKPEDASLLGARMIDAIFQEFSHMQYFVTGATGFIGKRLVKKLLERKGQRRCISCCGQGKCGQGGGTAHAYWGVSAAKAQTRAVAVHGDLTSAQARVFRPTDVKKLKGQIDHFHHLAAVYDLSSRCREPGRP
jgi:hypothetical protein